jgi:hypothetical protein
MAAENRNFKIFQKWITFFKIRAGPLAKLLFQALGSIPLNFE